MGDGFPDACLRKCGIARHEGRCVLSAQLLHYILAGSGGEQVSSHSGHETSVTGAALTGRMDPQLSVSSQYIATVAGLKLAAPAIGPANLSTRRGHSRVSISIAVSKHRHPHRSPVISAAAGPAAQRVSLFQE